MSSRKTFVLRNVPVKTNSENLPQGPKVGRSKSASLFESKKAVDVNKSKQITSFFKPTKSSKLFDVYAEENAENLDVYMVDKEVNAVPTTSEIGCQTDIAGIENHYEDPKLTIEDLTSIRPTITVYRRRITKLQKQTEDMLNDSLELSINLSRELGEMYELEDDIKALEDYEICQEDIEDEEEDE